MPGETPLIVRAHLGAPVAGPQPWVHFDAVLANAVVRLRGPRRVVAPTSADRLERIALPLAREGAIWCASALWPVGDAPAGRSAWRMRPALEYAHLIRERIVRIDSGRTKAYDEALTLWPQRVWEARCIGQPAEVRKLLRQISAIGKKCSQGYGRVVRWEVEANDLGREWRSWGGITRRPLPDPDGVRMGVMPPYWYRPWWQPAKAPGEAV